MMNDTLTLYFDEQILPQLSPKTSKNLSLVRSHFLGFEKKLFNHKVSVSWHGLPLNIHLQSEKFAQDIQSFFPAQWLKKFEVNDAELEIYIYDDAGIGLGHSYWQDEDAHCHTIKYGGEEWACQRDFVAHKNKNVIVATLANEVTDGFFNLMRWVLPRKWISRHHFLFHSSCVLDSDENAYLCLGPSGAGKTTISQFLPQEQVLGDDMNLVHIDDQSQFFVTPSLLGQKYENSQLFGRKFPLKGVFWLKKSSQNRIISRHHLSFQLKICSSLVNIFWQDLSSEDYLTIQKFIDKMSRKMTLKELEFSLDKRIWDDVFDK